MSWKMQLEKPIQKHIGAIKKHNGFNMVRVEGLEPPRLAAPEPKSHEYLYKSKPFPTLRHLLRDQKVRLSRGELEKLIHQRFLEMLGIIGNMRIDLGEHAAISVAENRGNGQMVMPLDKLPGRKAMSSSIAEHPLAQRLGNAMEAIADRKFSPCVATGIQEKLSFRPKGCQAGDDLQRLALQVDNAFRALAFGFLRWKYNTFIIKLDVPSFNMPRLLRPSAGLPNELEQVEKRIFSIDQRKDIGIVIRRHIDFPTLRLGLFELLDRVGLNVAKLLSPVVYPLHGDDSAASVGVTPALSMGINPLHDLVGLEVSGSGISHAGIGHKLVKIASVPFMCTGRLMRLAPSQELGCKGVKGDAIFHTLSIANMASLQKISFVTIQ